MTPTMDVVVREVTEADLPVFFEHQRDPEANRMAAFPARERDAFMTHWRRNVLGNDRGVSRTVVVDGQVAGNIVCWAHDGLVEIGYWIGREFWGKGIATRALSAFLAEMPTRPLYAHTVAHNVASMRVLEKCGFRVTDEPLESDEPDDGLPEVVWKLDAPS